MSNDRELGVISRAVLDGIRAELHLFVDDPIMRPKDAAAYLGSSPRTLRKLGLKRDPLPGTGALWGYRRSTLNRHLAELAEQSVSRHFTVQ